MSLSVCVLFVLLTAHVCVDHVSVLKQLEWKRPSHLHHQNQEHLESTLYKTVSIHLFFSAAHFSALMDNHTTTPLLSMTHTHVHTHTSHAPFPVCVVPHPGAGHVVHPVHRVRAT